jgi:alginate O-acetyltransferase complex protein AlgI
VLFNSIHYLLFFPIVFAIYWLSPKSLRRWILLVASYVFYMSWIPKYGVLLAVLTTANYFLGIAIERWRHQAKSILGIALLVNLGALCFFKYAAFLANSFIGLFGFINTQAHSSLLPADLPAVSILLPLGISFFVFEFLHYIIDIYRGDKPIKNFIDFSLFAAFFPSQIAGPIKRFQDFDQQLNNLRTFKQAQFSEGLGLLMQGLFKKVAIADNFAPVVAYGYSNLATGGSVDAWISVLGFLAQVYCDFSGYTDMGRGSAMMLGFSLPDNFNYPYLARSYTEVWKRWHISLSTWLRDYLYISLGGARVSRWRKNLNLVITMTIGGIWHGAEWHYVTWGIFCGCLLAVDHEYHSFVAKTPWLQRFHKTKISIPIAIAFTFLTTAISWAQFRALNIQGTYQILQHMFTWVPSTGELMSQLEQSPAVVATLVYMVYALFVVILRKMPAVRDIRIGIVPRLAVCTAVFIAALACQPTHLERFIYFQF